MRSSSSAAELRKANHGQARELMEQGLLDEALLLFQETLQNQGPHVGLLCDMAGCLYELAQYQECWELVHRIRKELKNNQDLLSRVSVLKTLLMLSKFFEEMNEPAMALSLLEEGEELCQSHQERAWFCAQELRVLSYLKMTKRLSKCYFYVTEVLLKAEPNLMIELRHSLMWTEGVLFGIEHAINQKNLLAKVDLNPLDMRLLHRDFLEIAVMLGHHSESVQASVTALKNLPLTEYDIFLISLLEGNVNLLNLSFIGLSEMMKLRLSLLGMGHLPEEKSKIELRKRFLFFIEDISNESKDLLLALLPVESKPTALTIEIFAAAREIKVADKAISLTNMQLKLLMTCAKNSSITLDDLSMALWALQYDEEMYHRARMLVYRINSLVKDASGVVPFQIGKEGLKAASNIIFKVN
jgi:hypothetical protein